MSSRAERLKRRQEARRRAASGEGSAAAQAMRGDGAAAGFDFPGPTPETAEKAARRGPDPIELLAIGRGGRCLTAEHVDAADEIMRAYERLFGCDGARISTGEPSYRPPGSGRGVEGDVMASRTVERNYRRWATRLALLHIPRPPVVQVVVMRRALVEVDAEYRTKRRLREHVVRALDLWCEIRGKTPGLRDGGAIIRQFHRADLRDVRPAAVRENA